MKEKLIEKVLNLFSEHKEIVSFLQNNSKNLNNLEKESLGKTVLKLTYLEAMMLSLCTVLIEDFGIDIKSLLDEEKYSLYYIIHNHTGVLLGLTNDKLPVEEEKENLLKNYTNGFKG